MKLFKSKLITLFIILESTFPTFTFAMHKEEVDKLKEGLLQIKNQVEAPKTNCSSAFTEGHKDKQESVVDLSQGLKKFKDIIRSQKKYYELIKKRLLEPNTSDEEKAEYCLNFEIKDCEKAIKEQILLRELHRAIAFYDHILETSLFRENTPGRKKLLNFQKSIYDLVKNMPVSSQENIVLEDRVRHLSDETWIHALVIQLKISIQTQQIKYKIDNYSRLNLQDMDKNFVQSENKNFHFMLEKIKNLLGNISDNQPIIEIRDSDKIDEINFVVHSLPLIPASLLYDKLIDFRESKSLTKKRKSLGTKRNQSIERWIVNLAYRIETIIDSYPEIDQHRKSADDFYDALIRIFYTIDVASDAVDLLIKGLETVDTTQIKKITNPPLNEDWMEDTKSQKNGKNLPKQTKPLGLSKSKKNKQTLPSKTLTQEVTSTIPVTLETAPVSVSEPVKTSRILDLTGVIPVEARPKKPSPTQEVIAPVKKTVPDTNKTIISPKKIEVKLKESPEAQGNSSDQIKSPGKSLDPKSVVLERLNKKFIKQLLHMFEAPTNTFTYEQVSTLIKHVNGSEKKVKAGSHRFLHLAGSVYISSLRPHGKQKNNTLQPYALLHVKEAFESLGITQKVLEDRLQMLRSKSSMLEVK